MRFLLGFLFGANYTGNRVFRVAFLLFILFMVFCFYQMSKPLETTTGGLLHRQLTAVDPVDSSRAEADRPFLIVACYAPTPVPEWLCFASPPPVSG